MAAKSGVEVEAEVKDEGVLIYICQESQAKCFVRQGIAA